MSKISQLAKALQDINEGKVSDDEARKLLAGIDPVELSLAEQELLENGVEPRELRRLCDVHLRLLEKDVQDLKAMLRVGHPLHTLISEHELILGFLDSLEAVTRRIADKGSRPAIPDNDLTLAREIALHLVETEKHHQREEDALFPALEELGITGPTKIMRLEHEEMRPKKKELLNLVTHADLIDYGDFNRKLQELSSFIVFHLRDHIFKENTILYPAAYRSIEDPRKWAEIARKCDEIGYCCFTPGIPANHMEHAC